MKQSSLKVLITGGNGQLASALTHQSHETDYLLMPFSSQELDITRATSIENAIAKLKPDVIINTAAYTAVDHAEVDEELAMRVNYTGAQLLAELCQLHQVKLVHLSTDYIFDGTNQKPYREDNAANPMSVYGKSKWYGEKAVREQCADHLIVRLSGVFSEFGNNFLKTILRLAKERAELRIVSDQTTCPTYAGDIANAIFNLLKNNCRGTYHFCNQEPVSWYQFANAIIEEAEHAQILMLEKITPIRTDEYPARAKRPAYSVLDCSKFHNATAMTPHHWKEGIKKSLIGLAS
jgi:dTDP-4-dehydrorhamnose reductase